MEASSANAGHSSIEDDRFDRYASQNEEWIIRLQNLKEEEEGSLKESQNDSNDSNGALLRNPATKAHLAATRTILHTARLANLQCASFAYREQGSERKASLKTDKLFLHVQEAFDIEQEHHQSILDSILPEPVDESSQKQKPETNASQSFSTDDNLCTSIEVDAFFEDYPECGRTAQETVDYYSESDTDSDSDEGERHQPKSRRRERRTQSSQEIASMTVDLVEAASEPLETQTDVQNKAQQDKTQSHPQELETQTPAFKDNQPETLNQQGKNRPAKPLSANNNHGNIDSSSSASIKNPYSNRNPSHVHGSDTAIDPSSSATNNDGMNNSYDNHDTSHRPNIMGRNRVVSQGINRQNSFPSNNQRTTERNNVNNTQQSQISANPYHRNKPQTTNQGYNRNNFHGREDSNSNDAWRDHRNQTNPFQTAREVALAEENHPHRDPYRHRGGDARSRPQHSYNNPYGHDFQSQNNNPSDTYQHDDNDPTPAGGGPYIPESLKRKFQRPKRGLGSLSQGGANKATNNRTGLRPSNNNTNNGGNSNQRSSNFGGQTDKRKSNESKAGEEDDELPEELQHLDKELVKKIQNEIMESGDRVTFDDIAGLADAKKTVREVVCWPMKRPDLFTGLRRAPNGLLLYGPPGTGKTLIGKAIAHESGATFFSISSSSLTSKWIGEGEKLVKTLFAVAAYNEPAVIFLDEIDSLLTQRKATENEASRRIKTEFLVQLDGTGTSGQGRVLIIGATNRPQELDEAARRRFTKRLYIPLPVEADRRILLGVLLKTNKHVLTETDINTLAKDTDGFSGADLKSLCTDAAMGPIRQLGAKAMDIDVNDVPPISYKHFKKSLKGTRPSVAPSDLKQYIEWDESYGTTRHDEEEEEED